MVCPGRGKGFADDMLVQITVELTGLYAPGRIAQAVLMFGGWPAWWRNDKYRQAAANGDLQLRGEWED